jgi:calcium-dependent protein kinase
MGCSSSSTDSSATEEHSAAGRSPQKLSPEKDPVSPKRLSDIISIKRLTSENSPPPQFQARNIASREGSVHDIYDVAKESIGAGRFGTVTKGMHKDKENGVAIKVIPFKTEEDVDAIEQELEIMSKLMHNSSIVTLHESFQDVVNVYIVMDLCNGGTLLDRIVQSGKFSELDAAKVMLQILTALQCLHDLRICHRDIKPENFMYVDKDVEEGFLKMIDFGGATFVHHGEFLSTMVGTPSYVAPEVLQGKYNETCDIWSAGIVLYVLLSGTAPFKGDTDEQVITQARLGNISVETPSWENVSEEAKDVVRELCQMRASDRPSAEEAMDMRWLASCRMTGGFSAAC